MDGPPTVGHATASASRRSGALVRSGEGDTVSGMSHSLVPDGVRSVTEEPGPGPVPHLRHVDWRSRHPWLVQGTTGRGGEDPFDMALFGTEPGARVHPRWTALMTEAGCPAAAHGRQVHGAAVRVHRDLPPGIQLAPPCDGHLTRQPGVLLAVTVADCVPVTLVHAGSRTVGALHAGWRGVAGGVLEAGLSALERAFGIAPGEVEVHLGPSICGACYEVGPEVHRALGLPVPATPVPVDVRAVLARRCVEAGVAAESVTLSTHCTRCPDGDGGRRFFSHRAGDRQRQIGFVGVRVP